MKRPACVGAFIVVSFLAPPFGAAQFPSPDHLYVLQASPRQATTTAPLTLTFSERIRQRWKRMVRQTEITIPATDVIQSLTMQVRVQKPSAFVYESTTEFLFVLDVRSRKIPARTSDPLVLTLASGAVVTVPPSCVHDAATRWLRVNLPSLTRVSAATASVSEPNKSDVARPPDQGPAPGSSLQFDTKGVDFAPWLRGFIAQVRRNWLVPEAEIRTIGKVVVTFFVHKNGAITDIAVLTPSSVAAFNNSAYSAVAASSPVTPLPAEYPDESAFFTVTFYFNESPPKAW